MRVSGSRFEPAKPYTVKLEGAKTSGYRSIFIAGARDPIFIGQIDEILAKVLAATRAYFREVPEEERQRLLATVSEPGLLDADTVVSVTSRLSVFTVTRSPSE